MRTIWKYELRLTEQRVEMPAGAELLHAEAQMVSEMGRGFARQGDVPMLWALVDPDAPLVQRRIAVIGTGHPAPTSDQAAYVGSAICGPFVWHVFDSGEEPSPNAARPSVDGGKETS